jgi:hypothetical protein
VSPRKALSAKGVVFLQGKVSFVPTSWISHACSEALEVEDVVARHQRAPPQVQLGESTKGGTF